MWNISSLCEIELTKKKTRFCYVINFYDAQGLIVRFTMVTSKTC